MRKFILLLTLAMSVMATAEVQVDDEFFAKRSTLLDNLAKETWSIKSPENVIKVNELPEVFSVDNIKADWYGEPIDPVSISFNINPETMALLVRVFNDDDVWYDHTFNSAQQCVVLTYEYDLLIDLDDEPTFDHEFSLAALEPDGTKAWISFANYGHPYAHFADHRPMSLADISPLILHLTQQQLTDIYDYLSQLSDHRYINRWPYDAL